MFLGCALFYSVRKQSFNLPNMIIKYTRIKRVEEWKWERGEKEGEREREYTSNDTVTTEIWYETLMGRHEKIPFFLLSTLYEVWQ